MLRLREMTRETVTPYDLRTADPVAWKARIAALAAKHGGMRGRRGSRVRPNLDRYAHVRKRVLAEHETTGETRVFESAKAAGKAIGVSQGIAERVARGEAWSANGWILIYEQAAKCTIR